MPDTKVKLTQPIQGQKGPITEVVIRQPRYGEVMKHGRPYEWHRGPGGLPLYVENNEALAAYAEACIVEPNDMAALEMAGTLDTLAIREAICDFFRIKSVEVEASKN